MKIIKIILHKYKRVPLIDSPTITIDFTNKLNLIIGTNGSGKSSLIKELSPLPSLREDFHPGGYKIITIEHNHHTYVLTSDFIDRPYYSFKMDDIELNDSNIITLQRDLAQQHFQLNQELYDMLTGVTTFTSMSTLTRKKVFNLISNINIDYVLQKYEDLKEAHKTETAIYKTQNNLLQQETAKLIDPAQEKLLQDEITLFKTNIDTLLTLRASLYREPHNLSRDSISDSLTSISTSIQAFTSKYYTYLTSYPQQDIPTIEANYKSNLTILNYKLDVLYKELETHTDTKRTLEFQKSHNQEELSASIASLNSQIANITNSLVVFKVRSLYTDPDAILKVENTLTSLQYSLMDTIMELQPNKDKFYNKSTFTAKQQDKQKLTTELSNLLTVELKLQKEIEHVTNHLQTELTECPNCHHKWNVNYTQSGLDVLKSKLVGIEVSKRSYNEMLVDIQEYLDKCSDYFTKYKVIYSARSLTYDDATEFWVEFDKSDYMFSNPVEIKKLLNVCIRDVSSLSTLAELKRRVKESVDALAISQVKVSNDKVSIDELIEEVNREIVELLGEKERVVSGLEQVRVSRGVCSKLADMVKTFREGIERLNVVTDSKCMEEVTKLLDDDLRVFKLGLINSQMRLDDSGKIQYLIEKYKKDIEGTQVKLYTLSVMIKELSPKDGIIAKTIGTFINKLIGNMNGVISSIWQYGFCIVPYNVEGEEKLDYRFKVEVNGELMSSDVTRTSGGMREIVDLAFRLTVMKFLKLDGYPIYLDELGVRLDSHHRSKVHELINSFVHSSNYSQIFMISHLDMSYGNIKDTDVIVMDGENIAYTGDKNILMLS